MAQDTQEDLSESANAKNERRRNLRFPVVAMVEVIDIKTQAKVVGRTNDLGLGGCYVDSLSPFPADTFVKLIIERESKTFVAEGRVVYSHHGMGMGIAFTSATRGDVRLFQKWILELSGKAAAEPDAQEPEEATGAREDSKREIHGVLNELILTLMRKNLLSHVEGKALLKGLYQ